MKNKVIIFAALFALAYLVGAMFNGLNTRVWPDNAKAGFCVALLFSAFMIMVNEDLNKKR